MRFIEALRWGGAMEPIAPATLIRLSVRAVTGAVGVSRNFRRNRTVDRLTSKLEELDSDASRYVISAVAEFQSELPALEVDGIAKFLNSAEADVFVRSVAIAILSREFDHSRSDMRDELVALLVLVGGMTVKFASNSADKLLAIVSSAVQRTSVAFRTVAPKEYGALVDRAMHEKNAGYLRSMADRAVVFRSRMEGELADILQFCSRYRQQVRRHTSELVPAYFDIQRRAPIESLYVQPRFRPISHRGLALKELSIVDVVEGLYRPVVLGDPGAGKSTFAQQIAYVYSGDELAGQKRIETAPFIVPLRAYEAQKRSQQISIPVFIANRISEIYHLRVPDGAIEYLLASGRAVTIFDGLDELLDIGRRQEVCTAVENFAALFSTTPVIATSRRIGYLEAPLQPSVFSIYEMLPFSDEDVRQYTESWFRLDQRLPLAEQRAIADAFIAESESVPDIRSNALMLGLLCNVYRGIREIPQNRAELYEKCAVMLFEQWDAERGIIRSGVLKADARAALQDVALWLYMSDELADGVKERVLLERLNNYWSKRYELEDDRLDASRTLLNAWKGRSWILTDVGSSARASDRIFKFTHQTFLEYFASIELVRNFSTPELLWGQLLPRVRRGLWDIVAQVAIQRLDQLQVDAADQVVQRLLQDAAMGPSFARLNLLSFATRNIDSLFLTSATCRALTRSSLDLCLTDVPLQASMPEDWATYIAEWANFDQAYEYELQKLFDDEGLERPELSPGDLTRPLRDLTALDGEHGRIARSAAFDYVQELMSSGNDIVASKAFLVSESLDHFINTSADFAELQGMGTVKDVPDERIHAWSKLNFWAALTACRLGRLSVADLVKYSGYQSLFCSFEPFGELCYDICADMLLRAYIGQPINELMRATFTPQTVREALTMVSRQLGDGRPEIDKGWFDRTHLVESIAIPNFDQEEDSPDVMYSESGWAECAPAKETSSQSSGRELDPEIEYAACLLLATFVEHEKPLLRDYSDDQVSKLALGPLQRLESLFVSRCVPGFEGLARSVLRDVEWPPHRVNLLLNWSCRRINFIQGSQ
jgi:NACHT domain